MRWLWQTRLHRPLRVSIISYPTRARWIIVNYTSFPSIKVWQSSWIHTMQVILQAIAYCILRPLSSSSLFLVTRSSRQSWLIDRIGDSQGRAKVNYWFLDIGSSLFVHPIAVNNEICHRRVAGYGRLFTTIAVIGAMNHLVCQSTIVKCSV